MMKRRMIAAVLLLLATGAMTACGQRTRSVQATEVEQTLPETERVSQPTVEAPDSTAEGTLPTETAPDAEGTTPVTDRGTAAETASSDGSDDTAL